jgi:hypothetical protein
MSNTDAPADFLQIWRRKILLIECNAKCRYLKNLLVKGLCGRFYLSEAPTPPMTPPVYSAPLHIEYVYTVFTQGRGGGELTQGVLDRMEGYTRTLIEIS